MIILCAKCGERLPEGERCDCDARPLTHLEAVVATAASLGRVDERNIRRAIAALTARPS